MYFKESFVGKGWKHCKHTAGNKELHASFGCAIGLGVGPQSIFKRSIMILGLSVYVGQIYVWLQGREQVMYEKQNSRSLIKIFLECLKKCFNTGLG